jgi:transposase
MRVAVSVVLSAEDRNRLERLSRGRTVAVRVVERARIILLAAGGKQNQEIAKICRTSRRTVGVWRRRFAETGIDGILKDAPRSRRRRILSEEVIQEIVRKTTQETPPARTHWSTRSLAKAMGLSPSTIGRVWRSHGLKPHLTRSFKLSRDPRFLEKMDDVIGLYLNPPEHALVFSVDEKSQIQALDRTQPGLPLVPGRSGTMTHDYKRHGTTTLFTALNTLDGTVIGKCMSRHRHQEWIKFLGLIDRKTPQRQRDSPDRGQLRDPQTSQCPSLAGASSTLQTSLHSDQCLMAQHGRALLPRPDAEPTAPRCLPQRRGPDYRGRGVLGLPQPRSQAVHLDEKLPRHPREGHPGTSGSG